MPEEKYNQIHRSRKEMLFNNFLGGIAWSLGTIIGATIIVGILGFILTKIDIIPIIGSFISQIIEVISENGVK